MVLYHATTKKYVVGKTYSVDSFCGGITKFFEQLSPIQLSVEKIVEEVRPVSCYPRRNAMFFCAEARFCCFYAQKQYGEVYNLYKVEVPNAIGGFPIVLVRAIEKHLSNHNLCVDIAKEYWNPQHLWHFLEYTGQQMIILEECQPCQIITACMQYHVDIHLSNSLYERD